MTEDLPTLLVVDDEGAIRTLLARIGQRAGFAVDTAKDGVEALEKLRRKDYMIAIVDLMMPRLSGYELVNEIGKLTPRPFVIVATAMASGAIASLDDSLVRQVIRKPFDIQMIAAALIDAARQVADARAADAAIPAEVVIVDPGAIPFEPPSVIDVPLETTDRKPGDRE